MKPIKVERERTGTVRIVGAEFNEDSNIHRYRYAPDYGPGWSVRMGGRVVAWRSDWREAQRVACEFAKEYSGEPVPLFSTSPVG